MADRLEAPDRDPRRGVRRLAVSGVVATLVLIAMGGAVRATDSGLACPDWPACYGQWIPPADVNIWLEHSHRLWAGVVGLLILWLTVWTAVRHRERPWLWRLSATALLLVLVQAGLGAAVVLFQLQAGLVTSHLGMSLVIVGALTVIAVRSRPDPTPSPSGALERRVGRGAAWLSGLVFLQALLGGQATGRAAAYVFNAFPIWLADDVWTGQIRQVLHVSHRFAGYLVAGSVLAFAVIVARWRRSAPPAPRWVVALPRLAAGLVVVQVGLGIANVLTRATVWSATAHLAVASWLFVALVLTSVLGISSVGPGRAASPRSKTAASPPSAVSSRSRVSAAPSSDEGVLS